MGQEAWAERGARRTGWDRDGSPRPLPSCLFRQKLGAPDHASAVVATLSIRSSLVIAGDIGGRCGTCSSTWGLENFRRWALRIWRGHFPHHGRFFFSTRQNSSPYSTRWQQKPVHGRENGQTI